MSEEQKAKLIAEQNDLFRSFFYVAYQVPGRAVCTAGIAALPHDTQTAILRAVATFDSFEEGDDPHGEHDFGALTIDGVPEKIFWKIDYYANAACDSGAEDPADPAQTFRVLTIMLATEY